LLMTMNVIEGVLWYDEAMTKEYVCFQTDIAFSKASSEVAMNCDLEEFERRNVTMRKEVC
jgi:hypothetical protein